MNYDQLLDLLSEELDDLIADNNLSPLSVSSLKNTITDLRKSLPESYDNHILINNPSFKIESTDFTLNSIDCSYNSHPCKLTLEISLVVNSEDLKRL